MVDEIRSSILRDQLALGIFLHIEGTFDNLNVKASIRGMQAKHVPPPTVLGVKISHRYDYTSCATLGHFEVEFQCGTHRYDT